VVSIPESKLSLSGRQDVSKPTKSTQPCDLKSPTRRSQRILDATNAQPWHLYTSAKVAIH